MVGWAMEVPKRGASAPQPGLLSLDEARILTRSAIEALIDAEPRVGTKLLLTISARLAQRLRDNARKLKLYAKLAQAMIMEMDGLIRSQGGGGVRRLARQGNGGFSP